MSNLKRFSNRLKSPKNGKTQSLKKTSPPPPHLKWCRRSKVTLHVSIFGRSTCLLTQRHVLPWNGSVRGSDAGQYRGRPPLSQNRCSCLRPTLKHGTKQSFAALLFTRVSTSKNAWNSEPRCVEGISQNMHVSVCTPVKCKKLTASCRLVQGRDCFGGHRKLVFFLQL